MQKERGAVYINRSPFLISVEFLNKSICILVDKRYNKSTDFITNGRFFCTLWVMGYVHGKRTDERRRPEGQGTDGYAG